MQFSVLKKITATIIVIAVSFLIERSIHETNRATVIEKAGNKRIYPEGIGDEDDPGARIEYERRRLADPATGKIPENIRSGELAFAAALPKRQEGARSSGWLSRGPYNVGGRTRALALDANNENIIMAGGVTGGMWRSTNGGASFVKTTTPDQFHSVTCIAQDKRPGKTQTWYYGTGEYYGVISAASFSNQASGNGIYKSTNGGQSWQVLSSTVSNTPTTLYTNGDFDFIWNIITDPTDAVNDVVYAAVINGIYRSKDGGQTWVPVLGLDSNLSALSYYTNIAITPSGVLYAMISSGSNSKGIWRSVDGDNWVNITPAGFPASFRRVVIAIAPTNENKIYFLANTPGTGSLAHNLWHYTYLSGDGSGSGGVWENRTAHLPDFNCAEFYNFIFGSYDSQDSYCMAMAVKPDDENVVFIGGIDVHRSVDGFQSDTGIAWIGGYQCDTAHPSNYIYPNHHPDQHYFMFLPSNPNVLLTASDGGIHKTMNCMSAAVQWQSVNNGYVTSQFYTVAVEPGEASNDIMVGGMQDNGTFFTGTADPAQQWAHVFYGDGAYCAINEGRSNYYLSWQTGKTFKFEIDDNGNVNGLTRIDPVGGSGYQFINPFILDPTDNNIMYLAAGRYLWRNNDLASIPIINNEYNAISTGWERLNVSNVGIGGILNPKEISALAMSESDPNTVYYGTTNGELYRLDSLRTANPVKTSLRSTDFPANAYVSCINVNPADVREALLSFSNYEVKSIFHTQDGGLTWEDISGNLEEHPDGSGNGPSVTWVEFLDLTDSTIYYAGTSVGLYSTTSLNGSQTVWSQEGSGTIGNVIINMVKTRSYDGLVVVATHGNGVYSRRYKEITAVREIKKEPEIILSQNFPNPFSIATLIEYQVKEAGLVTLKISGMDGKTVATLVNQFHTTGNYTINWNGKDQNGNSLSSGNYFYTLLLKKNHLTKKMVFLR